MKGQSGPAESAKGAQAEREARFFNTDSLLFFLLKKKEKNKKAVKYREPKIYHPNHLSMTSPVEPNIFPLARDGSPGLLPLARLKLCLHTHVTPAAPLTPFFSALSQLWPVDHRKEFGSKYVTVSGRLGGGRRYS